MSVLLARRPNLPGAIHVANSDSPTWAASGQVRYRARQRNGDPRKVVLQRGTRDARGPGARGFIGLWPVAWRRAYPWRRGGSGFKMDILAGIVGQALRMIGFWWVSGMRETLTSAAQQEQAGA